MARTPNKPQEPEVDWLLALMLERKYKKGMTVDDIARDCEVSATTINNWFSTSPWSWPQENRQKVCECLNITREMRMKCYTGE